ncbi:MAG: hypothetical protein QNJ61_01220 [Desulfobacterales bacterium]|nr:hypothetical protein [Desulfobacterales bacterium]
MQFLYLAGCNIKPRRSSMTPTSRLQNFDVVVLLVKRNFNQEGTFGKYRQDRQRPRCFAGPVPKKEVIG